MKTETDPVSETLCFSERQMMDTAEKISNVECHTSSSEQFGFDNKWYVKYCVVNTDADCSKCEPV
jgi:hypothetical protein